MGLRAFEPPILASRDLHKTDDKFLGNPSSEYSHS